MSTSQDQLQTIIDTIPTLAWSARPDGEAEFFNRRWLEYAGLSAEQARDCGWTVAIHPDDLSGVMDYWRSILDSGDPGEIEARLRRFDGEYRWFLFRASPLRDESGVIVKWYGTNTDIEDRKRAEQELRSSEQNLRLIVDTIPGFVWTMTTAGEVELVNRQMMDYFGKTLEELKDSTQYFHPDDRERVMAYWASTIRSGQPFEIDHRLRRADGMYRWFRSRGRPLRDAEGRILLWYNLITDIEDQKQAEYALRESEHDFRQIVDSIPAFAWYASPDGKIEYLNQRILDYTGERLENLVGFGWANVLHSQDVERTKEAWLHSVQTGQPCDVDQRVRRFDNIYRWFRTNAQPFRDQSGRVIRWYGVATDIEDLKRAEEGLREREHNLRLVVDSIPGLVCTMNPTGELQLFNRQILEFFGKTPEELGSWATSDVIHPDDLPGTIAAFRSSIETGQPYNHENRCRRADGLYRWFQVRALPLRDTEGRIIRWYALHTDIEDRKQAEDRLQLLLEVTNQVVSNLQLQDLLRAISQHVRRVMQCDCASLALPDVENKQLRLHVLDFPEGKGFIKEEGFYSIEESPYGTAFRTMKPLALESPFASWLGAPVVQSRADEGFKSLCFVPLISRNRAIGTLNLGRLRGDAFTEHDLNFLGQVASQIAIAVENVTAYRQIEQASAELEKAFEEIKRLKDRLQNENLALREQIDQALMFEDIVGASPALRAVLSRVSKVAPANSTVLLTGETGTGKELIARAIHKRSGRSSRAFVSVNCAAIPSALIASELFGHEKGAFTGASQRRLGRFELADGGTIFLDEVGELPPDTQVALLRALQEREFERVGGTQSIQVDVRVIAATNRDLEAGVAAGTFRSDLFYRLNVFPIEIPPLRERKEDIPMLVEYFIDRFARKAGKSIQGINKRTLNLLLSYPWPGNIRELQNVVERSVILCETENFSIDESWLSRQPAASEPKGPRQLSQKLAAQEKDIIEAALRESGGRVSGSSGAAAKLGIHRSTLESKITSLKINKYRFRAASPAKNS